jgi:hypothetical protein
MKKFLFLLVLLISICSYAQTDSLSVDIENTVSETTTTAERIIDKYSGKAYEAVKELANALKVPAEYVFTVLVKQGVVVGVTWLILFIFVICTSIIGLKWWTNPDHWLKSKDYRGDPSFEPINAKAIIGIVVTVISFIGIIVCFAHMDTMITGLLNPEYYAINEVLELIKK